MEKQVKFGLLGKNIAYSFSQKYFTDKFKKLFLHNHTYEIFDRENLNDIHELIQTPDLKGFNVTIPYKQEIIPHLDSLSEEAEKIGAVNTVKIENGKTTGYNTDAYGFEKTLLLHKKLHQNSALILGDGGAAKAVKFVLNKHKIPFEVVSRKSEINFENLSPELVSSHKIIIQTTPVGTFPNVGECLKFPFEALTDQHLIIDLIYNPNYTEFIRRGSEFGAKSVNGFYMLEQQAEKAWEIWSS